MLICDNLCYFCLVLLCFRVRLLIDALWSPAGKGLTSWLSLVMSNCEVVTFPLVSWVGCGAWLYRFLVFVIFLTFIDITPFINVDLVLFIMYVERNLFKWLLLQEVWNVLTQLWLVILWFRLLNWKVCYLIHQESHISAYFLLKRNKCAFQGFLKNQYL